MKLSSLKSKKTETQPKTLRTLAVDECRHVGGGAFDALGVINYLGRQPTRQDRLGNHEIQRLMQVMN